MIPRESGAETCADTTVNGALRGSQDRLRKSPFSLGIAKPHCPLCPHRCQPFAEVELRPSAALHDGLVARERELHSHGQHDQARKLATSSTAI
jgi:hypothetical protein